MKELNFLWPLENIPEQQDKLAFSRVFESTNRIGAYAASKSLGALDFEATQRRGFEWFTPTSFYLARVGL